MPWKAGRAHLLAWALGLIGCHALAADQWVIVDNDWTEGSLLIPLMSRTDIHVLGLTLVTGDAWRDQGGVEVLRFLEDVGAHDIPVMPGAMFPLVNTRARMLAWEKSNGIIPWKGAWNDETCGPGFHPQDPYRIIPPLEGLPNGKVAAEGAVGFMIAQVHARPHQVTILAEGPLTNLALAIRLDPDFASLAKRLIFTGGNLQQLKADGTVKSDFNFIFDPEAAEIVLSADWPAMLSVGDVADRAVLSPAQHERIGHLGTPAAVYFEHHRSSATPLWGELAAAILVDASLVTRSVELKMSVDVGEGPFRGRARVWLKDAAPGVGEKTVTVVQAVDQDRFFAQFIDALARPAGAAK